MLVGSTFSGVGGLDLGLERAGMEIAWQAEIDQWCRSVLEWHWPNIKIYNDVKEISNESSEVELLVGGFPCQDLSIAGRRTGIKGTRSSLFFEFARIAEENNPKWILLENVGGLLSSSNGRDFEIVISTLAKIGYGLCWRYLDARYFGVPQRRGRVFIVGCLAGTEGRDKAVRALSTGSERNFTEINCSWHKNTTTTVKSSFRENSGIFTEKIAKCLTSSNERINSETESFVVNFNNDLDNFVRRLTPIECERLMSWPDNWTAVFGTDTLDKDRYSACGNGVVSNVSEWIGRRIMAVENE